MSTASEQPHVDNANADNQKSELVLSPSERMGYQAATNLSGGPKHGSTQRALGSVVLGFELIVIFLTGLTLFGLNVFQPREIGLMVGFGLCFLCVLGLALMRTRIGVFIGYTVQLLLVLCGCFLPAIWFVALLFGGLWIYCMVRGAKIDRDRAEFFAAG